MSLDPINAELLKRAEREFQFANRGLDVVEPLLTEARERANGERRSLPSVDDVRHLLGVIDGLQVLVREIAHQRDNFRLACDDRDAEIARLLRDEQ